MIGTCRKPENDPAKRVCMHSKQASLQSNFCNVFFMENSEKTYYDFAFFSCAIDILTRHGKTCGFPTLSDTKCVVLPLKMARGMKFGI